MQSPFSTHTLDNGLQLVFESIPRINSAALGFYVHTGSRDEPAELAGVSHFLEHMCFKGTANRDWRQLSLDVDDLGAMWNAYTWWEGTAYFHWVQSERAGSSAEILADMMRSTLPQDQFDMEKKVILEEIAMYRDRPDALIIDELIQEAFAGHPLGQSVLGTEDTIGSVSREQMADYFNKRYAPDNMTLVITGRFDRDSMIRAAETHCGGWEPRKAIRQQVKPAFHPATRVLERPNVVREHIAMAFPAPCDSDDWATTADLLAHYLGAASNSRLFWSVVQTGLADEASADFYGFSDTGLFYVYVSVDPQNVPQVLEIVRREIDGLKGGVDEEALARSRTRQATALVVGGEHGLRRFSQIVGSLSTDTPLKTLEEELAEIDAVTPERVAEYLERYPLDRDPALVALGPLTSI
ncbi:MAG: insulinase family protein [Candidatus Latescibacteria bacterium]|nr:insulinase family protein [Candidatus Latescibacterota bacterium]